MKNPKNKIMVIMLVLSLIAELLYVPHIHASAAVKDTNNYCTSHGAEYASFAWYSAAKDEHGHYYRTGEGTPFKDLELQADQWLYLTVTCPDPNATFKWSTDLLAGYGWQDREGEGRLYHVAPDMPAGHHYAIYCQTTTSDGTTYMDIINVYTVCEHQYTISTKPGTCQEYPKRIYSCSICGYEGIFNDAAKLDHDFRWVQTYAPTCTVCGSEGYKCSYCDLCKTFRSIPELGHNYVEVSRDEPTCTTRGSIHFECTRCDSEMSQSIAELSPTKMHSYDESKTVVTWSDDHTTCTKTKYCIYCGYETLTTTATITHDGTGCGARTTYTAIFNVMGFSREQYIEEETHDIQDVSFAATCATRGYIKKMCVKCGIVYKIDEMPYAPHTLVLEKKGTPATCTQAQVLDIYRCTSCGATSNLPNAVAILTPTPAFGHHGVKVPGYPATETTDGKEDSYVCERCGLVTLEGQVIPALNKPHCVQHVFGDVTYLWNVPTCTASRTCTRCNLTEMEVACATVTDTATCTKNGVYKYEAVFANEAFSTQIKTETSQALGHTEVFANNKKDATCTEAGHESDTICSVCGITIKKGATIPKTEHVAVISNNAVEATCTKAGREADTVCGICNTIIKAGKTIPKLSHTEVSANNKKDATCTEAGHESDTICSVCGVTIKKGATIPKTEHVAVKENNATAATCTKEGHEANIVCKICNTVIEAGKVIKATGHKMENVGTKDAHAKCKVCGEIISKHDFTSEVVAAATCCEKGTTKYTCNCGYTYTENDIELDKTNHVGTVENTGEGEKHAVYSCCGEIALDGHKITSTIVSKATCTEAGVEKRVCECGYEYETDIPALGHQPSKYYETLINATCSAPGLKVKKCSTCGEELEKIEVKALPHQYVVIETKIEGGKLIQRNECTLCHKIQTKEKHILISARNNLPRQLFKVFLTSPLDFRFSINANKSNKS